MTELKTLKDLEFGRTENEDKKILKAEAINWIKHLERRDWEIAGELPEIFKNLARDYTIIGLSSIEYFIKHFFNITDEDLK